MPINKQLFQILYNIRYNLVSIQSHAPIFKGVIKHTLLVVLEYL